MSVYANLLLLKAEIEAEVPTLLNLSSLTALDEYVLGGPTDEQYSSLGVYLGPGDEDAEQINFKPVIQLQLSSVSYPNALPYFDVIFDFVKFLDAQKIGMLSLDRISYTEYPPDETGSTIFSIYLEYKKQTDDCDTNDC